MSITATIDEPMDDLEEEFNIPVCSEALYKKTILAVANSHNLPLFGGWGTFTEIDANTFSSFNEQLVMLKEGMASLHEVSEETKAHVLERLNVLQQEIAKALKKRDGLVILIG